MPDSDTQFPSHYSPAPSPFNRGPMTSVEGDYADPIAASQGPTSFGGNVDLPSAFAGTLSDIRAMTQQATRTLEDIGVMAQRVSAMLGGTDAASGINAAPVPNVMPDSPFGSFTSSGNVTAAIAQAIGVSYGSAANATPQGNQSYSVLPPEMTNPSFASLPTGVGPGTAAPVPPTPSASQQDQTQSQWGPTSSSDYQGESGLERLKQITSDVLGVTAVENKGGEQAHQIKGMTSVRSITANLAGRVQNRLPSSFTSKYQKTPWNQMAPETKAQFIEANASGSLSDEAFGAIQANGMAAESTGIGAGLSTLAGGGTLTEAGGALLGGGVMGAVGLAALPIAAGVLGLHEMESQRAENAQIQSQIGGSNFSAFGTRAQGAAFGFSQLGTMGMGMANQAFMGVTDLGLQGGNRQDALNFITQNYTGMGMSIADSLALVNTSVKAGNANLTQLASTLNAVTNSAAAASVNTEQARQNFTSMYQAGIASGMSTSGSAITAGAAQMLTNQLGISGQGAQFGQANPAQAAAAVGMPLDQYMATLSAGGPAANALWGQSQQAVENQRLQPFVAGIPNVQHLAALAQQHHSGGQSLFAHAAISSGQILPQMLPGILNAAGINTQGMNLNGMWDAYASVIAHPNQLPNAINKTTAESAINQQISKLRPTEGATSGWGWGNPFAQSTSNHQLSGAETNVDQYISKYGANSAGAGIAAALLAHGAQDKVTGMQYGQTPGYEAGSQSVQSVLGQGGAAFAALLAGKGTISVNGKNESISKFVAAHKTALTPKSSTKANNTSGSGSAGTIGLTPAAAQLVQILPAAASQAGNLYGMTPPTGVSPNNNAFSGA